MPLLAVDQGVYSASNFAVAALAGRALGADDFGRFAFILLTISIVGNLARAVWHEPDLAAVRAGTPAALGPRPALLGSVALLALIVGIEGTSWPPIVGAALAAALAQDRVRYRAIALGHGGRLLAGDLLWLTVVGSGLVGLVDVGSTAAILQLWLVGAALGVTPHLGLRPASGPCPDGHGHRDGPGSIGGRRRLALLTDFLLFTGMTQIGGLTLAAFLDIDEFADLRGAIILFGPIGVLTSAVTTWIFASLEADDAAIAAVRGRAALLAGSSFVAVAAAAAVPRSVGEIVLGSGWPPRAVLVVIGLSVSCQALSTPGMMLLRLLDDRKRLLRLRLGAFATFAVATSGLAVATGSAAAVAVAYLGVNAALSGRVWLGLGQRNTPAPAAGQEERTEPGPRQDRGQVPAQP